MGAGKWQDHFAEHFAGIDVVILPDNDDAGRNHADKVARNLAPVAERVRIVALPGLPHKGDVSDWIAAGGTAKQLCELAAAAETFDPARRMNRDNTVTLDAAPRRLRRRTLLGRYMEQKFEPLRWTVPGYLPEGLSILAGRQKLGKTWLAIDLAVAVGTGGRRWATSASTRATSCTSTWRTASGTSTPARTTVSLRAGAAGPEPAGIGANDSPELGESIHRSMRNLAVIRSQARANRRGRAPAD